MESSSLINSIFYLDTQTVMKILFMGNASFAFIIIIFQFSHQEGADRQRLRQFMYAKLTQTLAWFFVLFQSSVFSFPLTNLGNIFLFIGLYFESKMLLGMALFDKKWLLIIQDIIFVIILIGFNVNYILQTAMPVQLAFISYSFFFLLCIPGIMYTVTSDNSIFKRIIGISYIGLFLFSLFRGMEALRQPINTFNEVLQNVSLVLFILIMIIGSTGELLFIKEEDDHRIRDMAFFDPLTTLLNRRRFLEEAERCFAHHARYAEFLSILFLDIDHFKKVNDQYGHRFGDEVLKDFASLLQKSIRSSDVCGRYGGEEFVVVLAKTQTDRAISAAKRLQAAITLSSFSKHPEFAYTVSIGVYSFIPLANKECFLEMCIEKSDMALYRAKENGRNRIEVYEDEDE